MTFRPYSYSKLSLHKQCGKKFKFKYIDKLPPIIKDDEPLKKGSAVHKMLEKYPETLYQKNKDYVDIFNKFLGTRYKCLLDLPAVKEEQSIGLDDDLEPCKYSKKALFRGFIDYFAVIKNTIVIVDWKTGKLRDPRYQDYNQLLFYAIYMFKKFTEINKIKIMYIYVEHSADNSIILERKYLENYINELRSEIKDIENSKFIKNKSKLCDWCDYQEFCESDLS